MSAFRLFCLSLLTGLAGLPGIAVGRKMSEGRSVRTDRWRFTHWSDGQVELYDHDPDPEKNRDVSKTNPEGVAQLEARLKTLPPYKPNP